MRRRLTDIANANRAKYLKPPPITQIEEFVKELDVSEHQFERFYGIPRATVSKIRAGARELPAAFWEIVYLKVKPAYGSGIVCYSQEISNNSMVAKQVAKRNQTTTLHNRINTIKTK